MRDPQGWAQEALKVYSERGQRALAALDAKDWDESVKWLSLRNAAWHNFLAYESQANKIGWDSSKDLRMVAILADIKETNAKLEVALEAAQESMREEANRLIAARQKIAHFRTSDGEGANFKGSV